MCLTKLLLKEKDTAVNYMAAFDMRILKNYYKFDTGMLQNSIYIVYSIQNSKKNDRQNL